MPGAFKDVPLDQGTAILFESVKLGDYDVLYQKWHWGGILADSLIFHHDDVADLSDEQLETEVRSSPLVKADSEITIKRQEHYTFVNFNFEQYEPFSAFGKELIARELVIYLHGFNSAPDPTSEKRQILQRMCDQEGYEFQAPTLDYCNYDRCVEEIKTRLIAEQESIKGVLFVGTSMGGFTAAILASELATHLSTGCVMINPAIKPWDSLRKHIGVQSNYVTEERYQWTEEHCEAFRPYAATLEAARSELPTTVLLDEGDDVIDVDEVVAYYQGKAHVVTYPGGSHRFDHMGEAVAEIRRAMGMIYE